MIDFALYSIDSFLDEVDVWPRLIESNDLYEQRPIDDEYVIDDARILSFY
jgi:hypothetical protein